MANDALRQQRLVKIDSTICFANNWSVGNKLPVGDINKYIKTSSNSVKE